MVALLCLDPLHASALHPEPTIAGRSASALLLALRVRVLPTDMGLLRLVPRSVRPEARILLRSALLWLADHVEASATPLVRVADLALCDGLPLARVLLGARVGQERPTMPRVFRHAIHLPRTCYLLPRYAGTPFKICPIRALDFPTASEMSLIV